jgi:ribonucleoside-diphosphate reductase alpha chain
MGNETEMMVVKRNGKKEMISFDKILKRLRAVGEMSPRLTGVIYTNLAMKVIEQLCNDITTSKIDELTAEQCHAMYSIHPDYNTLASRVIVSCHHKNTLDSFSKVMRKLYEFKDKQGKSVALVRKEVYWMVKYHGKELDKMCEYSRDFLLDYFGFKTLERSYLKAINKVVIERAQHMWLRVAIGIHCTGLKAIEIEHLDLNEEGGVWSRVRETYELMSQKYFTHATPTLYNAGTPMQQLSSCYLLQMESDSLDGIFNTLKECAMISKGGGGIGLNIHNIRATGSHIRGTDGYSNGIVPMLRVFNNTARYVDQCVHPSTVIYTASGVKRICDCVVGETAIFGREGAVEVIQDVLEHSYKGDILEIETKHSLIPLKITGQHPVYAYCGKGEELNLSYLESRMKKSESEFEWVDACELDVDDWLVYPIPSDSKDVSNITWDDCYMYGLIMGSDAGSEAGTETYLYVSNHGRGEEVVKFVKHYFDAELVEYSVTLADEGDSSIIRWSPSVHLPFRYADFYNEAKMRAVNGKWLNLPLDKIRCLLKGLLDAMPTSRVKDDMVLDTESFYLAEAIRFMCLKLGVLVKGYRFYYEKDETDANRKVIYYGDELSTVKGCKIRYCLFIPMTLEICGLWNFEYSVSVSKTDFVRVGDYVLSPIRNIQSLEYSGVLYDLQMGKEHNYLLSHGLVHNGGGKRKGSFAVYLEPWHADIELFLAMKRNQGNEELKARDLFYALWIPDLFMKRVKADGMWTLFCPDEAPGLADVAGDEFEELYCRYETEGRGRKVVKAQEIWMSVLDSQMETGNPYLLYKDSANLKSNQKNLGVIKSSNLCVAPETLILTDKGHQEIRSMVGQMARVWNGSEFSEVEVVQTGVQQELLEVATSDGMTLHCTPYHKFYVQRENNSEVDTVEAKDLNPGDSLMTCSFPILDGKDTKEIELMNLAESIPMDAPLSTKLDLYNLFCGIFGYEENENHDLFLSGNKELLVKLKFMLQTCGINPEVIVSNASNGTWKLKVSREDSIELVNIQTQDNTVKISQTKFKTIRIVSVQNKGRRDDTYCFNEPKKHAGIFNGILTSQCTEILQYTSADETAVCNLASIALPSFIVESPENGALSYDYAKLRKVARVITYNLNRVIDINEYPSEKARKSNMRHRPIGLGVQGLADVYMRMGLPFTSDEAKDMNRRIFETIYLGAVEESMDLGDRYGCYETFHGSPASRGQLQFDLWEGGMDGCVGGLMWRDEWLALKARLVAAGKEGTHRGGGLRNSLLVAPMPTASTSQILGFNECFEPITSNFYVRKTLAGNFVIANKYLVHDLITAGVWNERVKNSIIANNGSIQNLDLSGVVSGDKIKEKYRTVWEISMKHLIDMSADRGRFVCQSQSLNLWQEKATRASLTSMHFYAWSRGLKTGLYYLHTLAKAQTQQFSIEPTALAGGSGGDAVEEHGVCENCSA